MKNNKIHPLKFFNDQRDKIIEAAQKAQKGIEVVGEEEELTNKYDGILNYKEGENEGYHDFSIFAKRDIKKSERERRKIQKKAEREKKKQNRIQKRKSKKK